MESECSTVSDFITAMDAFVKRTTDPHACATFVERTLPGLIRTPNCLAPAYTQPASETYARHLVYHHPEDRYVIVAMVWSPGQCTPIHDHGGIWCVEGVYQGQMCITQYNVTPIDNHHAKAVAVRNLTAGLGNVGALIPPHEYHVMANRSAETAVTLHVYGGELKQCHIFVETEGNTYRVMQRQLHYTSVPCET